MVVLIVLVVPVKLVVLEAVVPQVEDLEAVVLAVSVSVSFP